MSGERYFGIYRGTVVNNIDPLGLARIMATVPDVGGITPSTWAMPCVPIAGKKMGTFMVPQIGAGVWVQFEGGDADFPVWTGGWWGVKAEIPKGSPPGLPVDENIVVQSTLQNALVISDLPGPTGGVILRTALGASITVNDIGIFIDNGKGATIELIGPAVQINKTSLVVM
jgi:uncharacterized protein involved in type VI secretion and phage assembly